MTRFRPRPAARRAGLTIVELMMAITVFTIVLGIASRFLLVQSRGFRQANITVNAEQNLRFAADVMRQDLVIAGANVPDQQPVLVYGNANAVAFNADYATNLASNVSAVFFDPDAPAGHVSALTKALRIPIPGSSPTFNYPDTNYTVAGANSDAETIMFYFEADPETSRGDDYIMRRQVNARPPEIISRGILPYPSRPFFRYYRRETNGTNSLAPGGWLPLRHVIPIHLAPTDTGPNAWIDLIRIVEVSYSVTNGLTGSAERTFPISFMVPLPNMGLARLRSCGDTPILGQPLVATPDLSTGTPRVLLSWDPAIDEAQGERDVVNYVLWRRFTGTTDWGDPYLSIPAGLPEGTTSYLYADAAVVADSSYDYAMAAQDCSPSNSPRALSGAVVVPSS
jgi:type II secretory pathway pseudopilin PulG